MGYMQILVFLENSVASKRPLHSNFSTSRPTGSYLRQIQSRRPFLGMAVSFIVALFGNCIITPPPPQPSLKKRHEQKFTFIVIKACCIRPATDTNRLVRADRRAWRKRHNRGGRRDRQYASTGGDVSPVG